LKPHLKKQWCIPPKENAAFVAAMEDVIALYCRPYSKKYPVVNMDEQPFQRLSDTRNFLPVKEGSIKKVDNEYQRHGTASIFMFTEALMGWRRVSVRERRTAIDWAIEIEKLLCEDYPDAEKVILISDNLNTHTIASFYKAFSPKKARELANRLDMRHTPKHGSWLNIAESELSVLTRQCLGKRIPTIEELQEIAMRWYEDRNNRQISVDWRFTNENTKISLSQNLFNLNSKFSEH